MWRSRLAKLAVICGVLLWLPAVARAADSNNGPEVALSVYRVVAQANGTETLAQAGQVKPGDRVEYAATYRNPGKLIIRNVQATLPIPGAMEYIPSSASPTQVYASLNGRDFAPVPLMRVVTQPDGTQRKQPVPVSEYRYLRWNLGDLEAGKSRTVKARMRVESQTTEAASLQTQGDQK